MFAKDHLNFSYRFVGEDQLTREAIGELENKSPLQDSSQADNRQSDTIKEALEMLKEVEVYNTLHRAAIELPSVQTPSQIKKFYETSYGYGRCRDCRSRSVSRQEDQLLICQIFQPKKR